MDHAKSLFMILISLKLHTTKLGEVASGRERPGLAEISGRGQRRFAATELFNGVPWPSTDGDRGGVWGEWSRGGVMPSGCCGKKR